MQRINLTVHHVYVNIKESSFTNITRWVPESFDASFHSDERILTHVSSFLGKGIKGGSMLEKRLASWKLCPVVTKS